MTKLIKTIVTMQETCKHVKTTVVDACLANKRNSRQIFADKILANRKKNSQSLAAIVFDFVLC